MTGDEYLELAKQKGWDVQIPKLKDGRDDCDIFGGTDVGFFSSIHISGTLFLEDDAYLAEDCFADGGIILGNNAYAYELSSENGNVVLGNHAETCDITGMNVICGNALYLDNGCDITATDGFVILGENFNEDNLDSENYTGSVFATEDIICDDE